MKQGYNAIAIAIVAAGTFGCNAGLNAHTVRAAKLGPVSSPVPSTAPSPTTSGTPVVKTKNIVVKWAENHEHAVNSTGGGYTLYYSKQPGFALSSASVVQVPYVSGASAPTTATLSSVSTGTYYIRIGAFSKMGVSAPSAEIQVQVP